MTAIDWQSPLVQYGAPALVIGLIIGALVLWGLSKRREASLLADLKSQEALAKERQATLESAKVELTAAFSELSSQSLRSNSENFLRMAEENLGKHRAKAVSDLSEREKAIEGLVRPIREALKDSQSQIQELEKARSEAYGGIKSQLEAMRINQQSLQQETQNLVKALRRPEVRGRWGEITLRRLVELAGMVEHCDFQEQVHSAAADQIIRPDMVVHMPNERDLVVDVKTPLDAYLEAAEANNDSDRQVALTRHARNVREHIRLLSSKAYWQQFENSPEFVILFIPGDQFLSAALNEEPDLIERALAEQIILATPTSFVALLKAVAYGWRQLALADNAKEIRKLAEDLYSRLQTFVGHMNKMGRQLASSVDTYNRAVGSLERKVLPGARKFTELGVQSKKDIESIESLEPVPRTMIESAADDDESTGTTNH
ncbi:MAG: DNA recombination protein RmuC [Pseudomonadota bacterium]